MPERAEVHEHQVVVGAAGDEAQAVPGQLGGQRLGVVDDLLLVAANSGCSASWKATALAAMTCISGPPWMPGKTAVSIALA